MPIIFGNNDTDYVIVRIAGNESQRHYLESMGFVQGSRVTLISAIMKNYIIKIGTTRVGVSQEYARRIIVRAA